MTLFRSSKTLLYFTDEETDTVVKLCEQEKTTINVTQSPDGAIATQTSTSRTDYQNCYIDLVQIPNYSWCGVNITMLDLHDKDVFNIQSGVNGDLVPMSQSTSPKRFYIPTMNKSLNLGEHRNRIQFHLLQAHNAEAASSSRIALLYTGR